MIRMLNRTCAAAFALLLAVAATTAAAQSDRPTLRATVTVEGDIVRISDLVENAGPVGDVAVFRAPDLGTTGAVATERVLDAIRPHQLIDIDTSGLAEVTVTRASRGIPAAEIADRIAQALSRQYGLGEPRAISVAFDRAVRTLQVEANATGELQVLALNYDAHNNRFDATLDLPSSPELHRQSLRFTGTAFETVEAVAVNRPVERSEVLQASDLTLLRRPKAQGGGVADIAGAAGLAARHALRPGQPLYAADLMKPEIVARNSNVTLVYAVPGLMLTLRGQAQEAGALGDAINVLNMDSKRVVQGVISGPDRVTVAAAAPRFAAMMPERKP